MRVNPADEDVRKIIFCFSDEKLLDFPNTLGYSLLVSKTSQALPAGQWSFDRKAFWEDIEAKMTLDRLSFREAAGQIGITAATLWRIKARKPDVDTVTKVCQWLARPLDRFVQK